MFFCLKKQRGLEDDVPAHVVDAATPCHWVLVGIFQTAQVALVGSVGQVGATDAHLSPFLAFHHDVGTRREGVAVSVPSAS